MRYQLKFVLFLGLALQSFSGLAQETDSYWDSLELTVRNSPVDTSTVHHLNQLFDHFSTVGGNKKTLFYAKRAWQLADSLQFRNGLALSALNLAIGHDMQGNSFEALKNYHRALELATEQNNSDYRSRCLLSLGYFYGTQQNYDKAIECTKESAIIEEELHGLNSAAIGWSNLGYYYLMKQQYDSALFFTLKSYEVFKAEKDSAGLGDVFFNLGNISWSADKNAAKALNHCLKALEMYKSSPYTEIETLMECKAEIGHLYIQLGKFDMAENYLDEALEKARENKLRNIVKTCYKHKAELYAGQGNFVKAYNFHKLFYQLSDSLYDQRSYLTFKQLDTEYELETQEAKIALLNKDKISRNDELERQLIIRNSFFGIVCMLLVLASVLFRNNHQKKKSNNLLLKQKNEIEEKNKAIIRKNQMLQEQKRAMLLQSRNLHMANQEINRQKETIEQKNSDITSSLNYARRIQSAMLPQTDQLKSRLPDAFMWLQPRDIVSGDFFWFHEQDNKLFIAAVDCTGHGVPGAFMSLIGDTYLNQVVRVEKEQEPDLILNRLSQHVSQVLKQETSNNQDGMEISLCVIDPEKKELHFAGARNHLFYVQNERLYKIKGDRTYIGGRSPHLSSFTRHTIRFNRPTKFYLYTDGIRDQFGGPQDKKLGEKQLNSMLLDIHHLPMAKQRMLVKSRLESWMEGYEQIDDILVLGWSLG